MVTEPPCVAALDLGVIADISMSVRIENLPKLTEALETLVDKFGISPDGTHMGLITFAQDANLLFDFNSDAATNAAAAKKIISGIDTLYLQTRTDKALILANNKLFTAAGGDRADKPNVLLVFTDGKPTPKKGYQGFDITVPPLEVSFLTFFTDHLRLYLRLIRGESPIYESSRNTVRASGSINSYRAYCPDSLS